MKNFGAIIISFLLLVILLVDTSKSSPFHSKKDSSSSIGERALSHFYKHIYRSLSSFGSVNDWFTSLLYDTASYIKPFLSKEKTVLSNEKKKRGETAEDYPFWRFIPEYITKLPPNSPTQTWNTSSCFTETSAKVSISEKGSDVTVTLSLLLDKPSSLFCYDYYLFATMSEFKLETFLLKGEHTFEFNFKNMSTADMYDVMTNGIRIFRFFAGEVEAVESLYDTVMLFLPPLMSQSVPESAAKTNLKFLEGYAGIKMESRSITDVPINESLIHSGDFFGVIRLDGLDPMLAWGMGATLGHTVIALWIDGQLYICESTTVSKYWPTNGIQKTPYQQWIKQAKAADYNVVYLPLSSTARKNFDEKKAADWVLNQAIGLPYGYHNMLLTWLDTTKDNLPCLPPDYKLCLSPELVQVLAGLVDKYDSSISSLMYNQALNKRVGHQTPDLTTAQVLHEAGKMGMNWTQLVMVPEQDEWVYSDGQSMVCDVFVCRTWKAGGLFGDLSDQIQCTEFTCWDAYALSIFDPNPRPKECEAADPDLPFCQILGKHRVQLPGWNSKAPFAHMAEKCPSLAPKYIRPADC